MKKMNKLLALILVLAVALSLAVPAMAAASTYSVTIVPSAATGVEAHTYEAYQIFSGVLDSTGLKLSEVEWGAGVDADALLTALAEDPDWAGKVTTSTSAQDLADLLADDDSTTAMLLAFRKIAGANLKDVAASVSTKDDAGNYVLDLTATGAGYYLIKDKDGSLEGTLDTYTNYMMRVVGQDQLHPKSGTTSVDKVIVDGGTATNAADYSIGDTVSFRVTGTLPMNYTVFTTFKYEFSDTMSKGLTYTDGSVKVYLVNAGEKLELVNPTSGDAYYTVNHVVNADSTSTLTVTFADLKAVAAAANRTIDPSTAIIMEYNAVLNQDAVIGNAGNPNEAKIIFSNNPYGAGEGETPEDYAWAFTWELDVTKTDDLKQPLGNAKFVFYREKSGTKQYVQLNDDMKVIGWTTDKDQATTIVSPANGLMPIIGLEADTYYLEEIAAPDGYNLLDGPVTVIISATAGTDKFTELEVKVGLGDVVDGDLDTGIVAGSVENRSGATLPETGGIGTTIFYILGSVMALGAVVLMITRKRMSV